MMRLKKVSNLQSVIKEKSISMLKQNNLEAPEIDLKDKLVSCLETDVHIKRGIVENLPNDIEEYMRNHLMAESERHKRFRGKEMKPEVYERVIAGKIFEMLCYEEYKQDLFQRLTPNTPEWERANKMLIVSSILCEAARDPYKFDLNIDEQSRIPDGVYVGITKSGNFFIYGLAEAKLGEIDERAISQLRTDGARSTMAAVIKGLQAQIDSARDKETLESLPENIRTLAETLDDKRMEIKYIGDETETKKPKMSLIVLVPNRGNRIGVNLKNDSVAGEFNKLVERESVGIKSSIFTAQEVHAITQTIWARIRPEKKTTEAMKETIETLS
jgi:hypothetical protein